MSNIRADQAAIVSAILTSLQILFVNLLLSADNALVIALASRGLPAAEVRRATLFGIVGGIFLRLAMGSVAMAMLRAPYLQLIAGLVLLLIAARLTLAPDDGETAAPGADHPAAGAGTWPRRGGLLGAIWAIILADAAMSLDNVVAIAAIAHGSLLYVGFGLAMSIPMLVWGSTLMRRFLDRSRFFVTLSGMFLGWIAGGIAISDPTIAPSIAAGGPALPYVAPLACAILVIWQSLIFDPRRRRRRDKKRP